MEFRQAVELVMPAVHDLKRRPLQQRGVTPLAPSLVALRDGRVLCAAQAPALDDLLALGPTMTIGLGPELLVVAAEMSYPAVDANPVTGQPWQPGETQQVAREHDGVAKGWVREGLAYTGMTRERQASMVIQDFTVTGDQIGFGEPHAARPSDRSLMDRLAAAMAQEPMNPGAVVRQADRPGPGPAKPDVNAAPLPAAEGRLVLDAGTVNALAKRLASVGGNVVFIAADPAHAQQLIAHGMRQDLLLRR